MKNGGPVFKSPVARSIPYDDQNIPTNLGKDVQEALDNLNQATSIAATPGFSWGRSGNVNSGTWLQNETVPSNMTGRNFPLNNGQLVQISVSNENSSTFTIEMYEHDGTTFTLKATVSLTAQRSKVQTFTGVSITKDKEIAIKVASGACKNPVVQAIFRGDTL